MLTQQCRASNSAKPHPDSLPSSARCHLREAPELVIVVLFAAN